MSWSIDNFVKTPYGVRDAREWIGNGDWSINTFKFIVQTNDKSVWARTAFNICWTALENGCRWPDAPFAMGWITADQSQERVSRDCYQYAYECALFLGYPNKIKKLKIPFKLYRPTVWAWRRYLITQKKKHLNRYLFWEWLLIRWPRREYAAELVRCRCRAADSEWLLEYLPEPKPNKS